MKDAPINELIEAIGEGLSRPHHFWTAILVLVAIGAGRLVSRLVRKRTQARLDAPAAVGVHVDALRFSIDGVRRLAFPLAAQAVLWLGELGLRLAGLLTSAADARLLRLAMMLFAALAAIRLAVYVLRRVFRNWRLVSASERAIALAIWIVVALHLTGWLGGVIEWLEATRFPVGRAKVSLWAVLVGALSVLVTLLAALWVGSSLESRLMQATSIDSNVRAVLSRVLRALLVLLAVLVSLSMVGIDITVLSVFGGALGVGLGLGLQRIASNYVSGFIILLDRSLRIGDTITVDKYSGAVQQINTRYTVVRAADGTEAIVPNEMLVAQAVTNHTPADKKARVAVKVVIGHDAEVARVMTLMEEAALTEGRVMLEPKPTAVLLGFDGAGLELELGCWIRNPDDRLSVQSSVALALLQRFRAAGVHLPDPRAVPAAAAAPDLRKAG